jgi:hypothetical protein
MAEVSYITTSNAGSTGAVTTHTYEDISLGDIDVNRWIIVTFNWQRQDDNTALSSATIGGVSATIAGQTGWNTGTSEGLIGIVYALVPAGTTGDIVLNFDGNMLGGMIGVFKTIADTISIHDSASADTTITDPLSADVDVLDGWFGVGIHAFNDATSPSVTWSGLTEAYDAAVGGGLSLAGSGAYGNFTANETPRAISVDRSDSTNEVALYVFSFTGTEVVGAGPMMYHLQTVAGIA